MLLYLLHYVCVCVCVYVCVCICPCVFTSPVRSGSTHGPGDVCAQKGDDM
jgi:hypothetical protein